MKMVFMSSRARAITVAAAIVLVALTGCTPGGNATAKSGPTIVTSVYPFQFVAERVAGTDATVSNLTAPGAEPHDSS